MWSSKLPKIQQLQLETQQYVLLANDPSKKVLVPSKPYLLMLDKTHIIFQ